MIRFPLPDGVFFDTSVVVAATYADTTNSIAAVELCGGIRRDRSTVHISEVLRLEFGKAIRRLATKPDQLSDATRDSYSLDKWSSHALVRQRWLSNGVRRLSDLLNSFHSVVEIPMSTGLWIESIRIMGAESLDATDALHIATARSIGVHDFYTLDSDFRRIESLRVHLVRENVSRE